MMRPRSSNDGIFRTTDVGCTIASLSYTINGLKEYRRAAIRSIPDWTSFDYDISGCINSIDFEQRALQQALAHVFGNSTPSRRQDWRQKHIGDAISSHLGSLQGRFRRIQDRLIAIVRHLGSQLQLNHADV
jgi:hypothetical protein